MEKLGDPEDGMESETEGKKAGAPAKVQKGAGVAQGFSATQLTSIGLSLGSQLQIRKYCIHFLLLMLRNFNNSGM